jgi:hypothetical protein
MYISGNLEYRKCKKKKKTSKEECLNEPCSETNLGLQIQPNGRELTWHARGLGFHPLN